MVQETPLVPEAFPSGANWIYFVHHLRNTIGTIGTTADFAGANPQLTLEQLAKFMSQINVASQAAMGYVDDFVELMKPLRPEPSGARLSEWLRRVCEGHPIGRDPRIATRWELDPALAERRIGGDLPLLERAVRAVLENAQEEMPEAGELTIALGPTSNGCARLSFRNTGKAPSPDTVQNAWEPFFTTKRGKRGVGLAWARKIVESHRGRVAFQASGAGGAVVVFELPLAAPAEGKA